MTTLNIAGKQVQVDDGFLSLSPDQQNATVDEIAKSIGTQAAPTDTSHRAQAVSALRGIPIVGAAVDKATAALNAIPGLAAPDSGMSTADTFSQRMAENEAKIKAGADQFEKDHPTESMVDKAIAGTVATAPLGATALGAKAMGIGAGPLLARAATGAATGAGVGALDAAARGEDPVRGAEFGGIGGVAGPVAGAAIGKVAQGALNSAAQSPAQNAAAQAAERLGVDLPNIVATDSTAAQRVGSVLKEIPVVGDPIVKASQNASQQMGDALSRVEQGYGSGSALNAGDVAKTGISDWITGGSGKVAGRLYGAVDNLVNPNTTRELSATQQTVANIATERQQAALNGGGTAVDQVLDAVTRPGGLNYDGLKTLRSSIGEMLDSNVLPADIRKSELKRIYGSLTTDLRATVQDAGGAQALKAFDRANTVQQLISQRRESLAKIIGSDASAAPERVMDRLIGYAQGNARADFNKLVEARKVIGNGWDEVASAAVSKIGRDADGNFSPDRFLTAYGKLSDNGKKLLFGSTGKTELVQSLEDIATLSRKAKNLGQFANRSQTGPVVSGVTTAGAMLTQPHVAIPALAGARLASQAFARSLKPRATTLQVAARNANVRALLNRVVGSFGIPVGVDQANRQAQVPQQEPLALQAR